MDHGRPRRGRGVIALLTVAARHPAVTLLTDSTGVPDADGTEVAVPEGAAIVCRGTACSLPVTTPEALAAGHAEFVVVTDARRKELYRRSYRVREDELGPVIIPTEDPRVGAPEDVPELPCYGSGAGLYPDRLSRAVPGFAELHPSAADLARAAWALTRRGQELSTDTSPLYLRDSDAKVPASPKRATR